MANLTAAQAASQITATPDYAANQGYPAGGAPMSTPGAAATAPVTPAPAVGGNSSTNSYAVVNSQPANNTLSSIGTAFQGIKQGMANQATANANKAVLPSIPGYTVSQTPTGAQGETKATNNANGQTYYITPQAKPASAGDVISALNGPGFGTGGEPGSQTPQTNQQILAEGQGASATPAPTPPTPANGIDTSGLDPKTADVINQMAQNNQDAAQAYATFSTTIQQVINGTFPLTTAQQALIDSTNAAFTNMSNYLKLKGQALSSETGGISNKIAASAGDLFNATQMQTAAVAKLEQAFQQQDYTQITDAYNEYTKAEDDKTATLKDMFDTATTATQDAITNAQKQQELDQTAKQNAITDKIALEGTYSHYTDANGNDVLYNTRTGATINASGDPAVTVTPTSTPGSTGNPVLDNNTNFIGNVPYVNLANIKGTAAQEGAQKNAAIMGIPAISNQNAIAAIQSIQTANSDQEDLNAQLDAILPKDATGRIAGGALNNKLGEFLQQNDPSGNILGAFGSWRTTAIDTLKALAGGSGSGLRINQAEIIQSMNNDIPLDTDTVGVAMQKMQNIQTQFDNAIQAIVGDKAYNKYNPSPAVTTASNALDTSLGLSSGPTTQQDSTVSSAFSGIGI